MSDAPWRKQLQPATFRNVGFSVKAAQTQVGRRMVIHEYAQRDEAYPEDMGRKARAFTVEALVIGPDYIKARDALIDALEAPGPGLLVHPYYGRRTVVLANPARISETPDEGGLARFSLDFVEAGDNTQPSARIDTPSVVERRADAAAAVLVEDFSDRFTVAGKPDFVEAGALTVAKDVMSALDGVRRRLVPDLSVLDDYTAAASGVSGKLASLIRTPADFANQLLGLYAGLTGLAGTPQSALAAYRGLASYGAGLPSVARTTPSRQQQATNQDALAGLTRRAALVESARVASRIEFDSYDQAAAVRDELAGRLDDEASGIGPGGAAVTVTDPVYDALVSLRAAMVRDINTRGADSPRISSATLSATLPALVAAYRIYGDATRADELVARNAGLIRHPGFVPGGTALEILAES